MIAIPHLRSYRANLIQPGIQAEDVEAHAAALPTLLRLARRVAGLNPNYPEIGDGMLIQLVTEARYALKMAGEQQ